MASPTGEKPDVRALIERQLRGPRRNFSRVRRVLDELVDGNDPNILQDFVTMWGDGDAGVRFWSMTYAHPMLSDGVRADGLLERLEPRLSDAVPANKAMAMGIYETVHRWLPRPLTHLVVANIGDTRVFTHHCAIRTLGRLGGEAAPYLPQLLDALEVEDAQSVASISIKLLAPHIPVGLRAEVERRAREHVDAEVRAQLTVAVKAWEGQ